MKLTEDEMVVLRYLELGAVRLVKARTQLYIKSLIFCPYDEPELTEAGEQALAEMRRP